MSNTDKELMSNALAKIDPTMQEIRDIFLKKDPLYEPLNLKRATDMLRELITTLSNNIIFAENIFLIRDNMINDITFIFNNLHELDASKKETINQKLNDIFKKILREENFRFNSYGIIGEGEFERITSLDKMIREGFLFHTTLEEELKKQNFSVIKLRIPTTELDKLENISKNVAEIKKGVERAYESNMRMINLALLIYSYVKLLKRGPQ